jgi:hypothetical protein
MSYIQTSPQTTGSHAPSIAQEGHENQYQNDEIRFASSGQRGEIVILDEKGHNLSEYLELIRRRLHRARHQRVSLCGLRNRG